MLHSARRDNRRPLGEAGGWRKSSRNCTLSRIEVEAVRGAGVPKPPHDD